MDLFRRTEIVSQCNLFKAYTDWHSHILPGVDDGVQTVEDSLKILSEYEKIGFSTVWLTPHIMEDIPNAPEDLTRRFEELKAAYKGPITLNLAAENMMDSLFEERLFRGELLCFPGDLLLVETSYFNPPMDLWALLERIKGSGYFPLLAHPERYIYMGNKEYDRLKSMGVLFQLNLFSLAGSYGEVAQRKAEAMLKKGYYNYTGTDLHRLLPLQKFMEAKIHKDILQYLEPLLVK